MGARSVSLGPIGSIASSLGLAKSRRAEKRDTRQRQLEAALTAEAEQKRLEETAAEVPTLQDEEVEEAVQQVRRKVRRGFGRRKTILSARRIALGAEVPELGSRPIGRPTLGGL